MSNAGGRGGSLTQRWAAPLRWLTSQGRYSALSPTTDYVDYCAYGELQAVLLQEINNLQKNIKLRMRNLMAEIKKRTTARSSEASHRRKHNATEDLHQELSSLREQVLWELDSIRLKFARSTPPQTTMTKTVVARSHWATREGPSALLARSPSKEAPPSLLTQRRLQPWSLLCLLPQFYYLTKISKETRCTCTLTSQSFRCMSR